MDEVGFLNFLRSKGIDKKICSDHISRIKRVEKCIADCEIEEEYRKDRCSQLLSYFEKKSSEKIKKVLIAPLPIGRYSMNTFRYSIKRYIEFLDNSFK